jgi:hypothetical protein
MNLDRASVETYLTQRFKKKTQILSMQAFGDDASAPDNALAQLKTYGYGKPVLIRYRVGDQERRSVLRTMAPNAFGHERRTDRAAGLLLSYDSFNDLPQHVRALDLGVLRADGQLASLIKPTRQCIISCSPMDWRFKRFVQVARMGRSGSC